MKKLTGIVLGLALVLCAYSAQAASTLTVSVPSAAIGASCTTGQDSECDDSNVCNGLEDCNAAKTCVAGTPLVCDNGQYCDGTETCNTVSGCVAGTPPCSGGTPVCIEDNNTCVECVTDDNCTGGAVCSNNICVECADDLDCPEDGDPCNGAEICTNSKCESSGNPCAAGKICVPNNINATAPPQYFCVDCVSDDNCTDALFCNGSETCDNGTCYPGFDPCMQKAAGASAPAAYGPVCDEATDSCVECIADDNCTNEAEPYCVNNTCVACRNDADCDNGTFCDGAETCDNGTCYPGQPPCQGDLPLCDEDNDTCVECFDDGDCAGDNNTPLCNGVMCVECIVDADCGNDETCEDGVCATQACDLIIKPQQVRINKMFRPVQRRFRITGGEGFNPYAELDFGLMKIRRATVNKKGVLKVLVTIPAGVIPNKGPYEMRVGDCVGTVLLK